MIHLSFIYHTLNLNFVGSDRVVGNFLLDSRQVGEGDVFLAIEGEHADGHDYVDAALKNGASLVLGSKPAVASDSRYLCLDDVQASLLVLAKAWRANYKGKVIAVTGTVGKTSTKELMAQVLRTVGSVSCSLGNFNNEWGVPLSLLNASWDTQWLVVEIGARYVGDVAFLASWLRPDVGIVTRVGIGHTLHMKDEVGVAACKYEMIQALSENALGVVQWQDHQRFAWKHREPMICIGRDAVMKNVSTQWMDSQAEFYLSFKDCAGQELQEHWPIKLSQTGQVALDNALLVASVMRYLQVPIANIQAALLQNVAVSGRGDCFLLDGCWIINDCYNANPTSMRASIESLQSAPGPRGVYLGDMLDLGEDEQHYHNQLIQYANEQDIQVLCTKGDQMKSASVYFKRTVFHELEAEDLRSMIAKHGLKSLLIKGSNGMALGVYVKSLRESATL